MVDLVAGDVLDEVDGFPSSIPKPIRSIRMALLMVRRCSSVGGARSILCGFLALLVGDALTLLLCSAGGGLFRLACSVGFGLLAGQLGGFRNHAGPALQPAVPPGLWRWASCSRCWRLHAPGAGDFFLPAGLLRRLLGYQALAVDAILFGLLLAQLLQLCLLGFVLLAGCQGLAEALGCELLATVAWGSSSCQESSRAFCSTSRSMTCRSAAAISMLAEDPSSLRRASRDCSAATRASSAASYWVSGARTSSFKVSRVSRRVLRLASMRLGISLYWSVSSLPSPSR